MGESAEPLSPARLPRECSDAGKHSEGMTRTKRGYLTAVRKVASVALNAADEGHRSQPEYSRVVRCR